MTEELFTGQEFSENGYIESNIKSLYNEDIENGSDQVVILVVGASNSSKTSLSVLIQNYILGEVNVDWISLNHEDFIDTYTTNHKEELEAPKKVMVYEEGRESFYRTNNTTTENKEAKNVLFEYRSFQNFVIINFQDISDFTPKPVLNNMIDMAIRTPRKGVAHMYSQNTLKQMWSNDRFRKFQGWKSPDVSDKFVNPEDTIPKKWAEYERQNIEKLNDNGEDKEPEPVEEGTVSLRLNKQQVTVLKYLKKNNIITNTEIVSQGIYSHTQTANKRMNEMVGKGFIDFDKGKSKKYYLTDKGETLVDLIN